MTDELKAPLCAMKPFFSYFGAKWHMARKLGPPQHALVIEPFAGSACYSTCWNVERVILIDLDPMIAGIWDYLIHVSSAEIMRIPADLDHVSEARVCQEAKWFLGYWFNPGAAQPMKQRSNWARKFKQSGEINVWSAKSRLRVAQQVERIRNWKIIHGSYEQAPDVAAHWHIDPPYIEAGKQYRFGTEQIDYPALARWCRQRRGFIQVCEADGADWLPFSRFAELTGLRAQVRNKQREHDYYEVIYQAGTSRQDMLTRAMNQARKDDHERDREGTDRQDRRAGHPRPRQDAGQHHHGGGQRRIREEGQRRQDPVGSVVRRSPGVVQRRDGRTGKG